MASVTSVLPRIFHWLFLVLAVLSGLVALAILALIVVNPHLPPGLHYGPAPVTFGGYPGTLAVRPSGGDFDVMLTAFRGTLTASLSRGGQLVELIKHYWLPVLFVRLVFFAGLFELLRRLFRNVEHGESFSQNTVRLVQAIAGLLIVFSLVFAFADHVLARVVTTYVAQHAVITISGAAIHFPAPHFGMIPSPSPSFPLGSPYFFSGLLVLALSEVFRQGLALRKENELTI